MIEVNAPYWPRQIIQGVGASQNTAEKLKTFFGPKCVLFTDKTILKQKFIKEIIETLEKNTCNVIIYNDIFPNPTDISVKKAVEFISDVKPDFFLCIGGGSVIDLGKAVNVLYTHGGTIYDYEDLNGGVEKIKNILLPLVAIPTTSGSGSEVSTVSVITDTRRKLKMGVLSPYIIPTISVLDPITTTTLPAEIAAYTGIDALVHCIEAYTSNINFEPGKAIALRGAKLIFDSIKPAVSNCNNLNAKMDMLIGSACGAMAFNNNYLGAIHGCAHQLSSLADIPHGLANAIMLPPILEWNIETNPTAYAQIANVLDTDTLTLSTEEAALKCLEILQNLIKELNIPTRLSDIGISLDMIDGLVENAFIDHNMISNIRKSNNLSKCISKADIKNFYMKVF